MAELVSYKPSETEADEVNGKPSNSTDEPSTSISDVNNVYVNDLDSRNEGQKAPEVVIKDGTSNGALLNENGEENGDENGKKKKEKEKINMVGFFEVFRFADCVDITLMIFGTICAMAHGAALPCMIIVFGEMTDLFVNSGSLDAFLSQTIVQNFLASINMTAEEAKNDPTTFYTYCPQLAVYSNNTTTCDSLTNQMTNSILGQMTTFAIYYIIIGSAVLVIGYIQVCFWMTAAERQSHRIRLNFFQNILRQDIGWFDTHESGELNTRLSDDINKIHDGIGDKVGSSIQWISGFITGFVIGFVYGWKLTLVILAISPLLVVAAGVMSKLAASMTSKELKAYAKAGAIAEEVLSSVRTVVAFAGQAKEVLRYNSNLDEARDFGVKKGFTQGLAMGFVFLVVFWAYALGFWYGSKLTRDEPDNYSAGKMLIVFFAVLIGAFSLGNAGPGIQALSVARGAAYTIYGLIDLVSKIDSSSPDGKKPSSLTANIEFRNVRFNYPSREEVKILDGISFKVFQGQTVALVGHSGCGKSTTVQLLQRYYDPLDGQIFLDDNDLRDLNIQWLRKNIGIVSQEPILFGTTIEENIRYGREGVSKEEVINAAQNANAHDFIMKLPEQYNTLVGERGAQLSGGQKQRVAIARALVRDPKILLLDEATSALDTESESIVQDALDKARQGRTTIVIAHRLSTVQTADIIIGLQDGKVFEQGSHEELMKKGGIYCQLVTNQTAETSKDKTEQAAVDDEAEIEALLERVGSKREDLKLKRMLSQDEKQFLRQKSASVSEDKTKENKEDDTPKVSIARVMRMNAPEWPFIMGGCFAALINGGIQPVFAILFSEILGVFVLPEAEQEQKVMMYSLILVGLGVAACLAMFFQSYFFAKSGENLTLRLRQLSFKALLRQEISYFDDHKNNTGALTTRLATDASQVQGATGVRLGSVVQNIANMGTAIVIAFIFGWKLTLVIFAFLPFIVAAGAIEMKVLAGVAGKNKEALEGAGKVATEAIENIRTVVSLSREETFYILYKEKLLPPYNSALKKAHLVGISFGASQAILYFAYAAAFWFGAYLINNNEMDYVAVFKVFGAIVFGAMAIGQASAFAPDASKAAVSAAKIFQLLDSKPAIDSESTDGDKLQEGQYTAKVSFEDVRFRYPTRPDVTVLRGLTISVEPGQTLALVGSSGCGKSTTVQILERFYDPESGIVTLDGHKIDSLNLQWLRAQMGIVSQEPVLFDRSIAENIAYGDNDRVVSMDEIISAARAANIHQFISSLPDGYETNVGDKGTQLSGGQKQRVAIARALIRNPKILLLDEATSALDTESEKVVQEALDHAREGRTSIVIAHRLSTIQNADKIVVIRNGKVTEQGKHAELMNEKGFYYKLNMAQMRQK